MQKTDAYKTLPDALLKDERTLYALRRFLCVPEGGSIVSAAEQSAYQLQEMCGDLE